jgi:glutaconate CoA-transferase subunit A
VCSLSISTAENKLTDLDTLATAVKSGNCVAIGGGLSSREPMALIRSIIRNNISNLTVVGSAHGIDIDLLCGANAVSASQESYVGFEQDFGMAQNYRRGCESGDIQIQDNCCYTLVQQLRASIQGLPFMPIQSVRGTDFQKLHSRYKTIQCPYTGDDILVVPPLTPDVAIIHAQYADSHGNLRIEGPPVVDLLFAQASTKVLATVEKIVTNKELKQLGGANIPYFYVTSFAEVPMGAHPTACYPFYAYDREHTKIYMSAAKEGSAEFQNKYLKQYVFECENHEEYLNRIGGASTQSRLASWKESNDAWMDLYRERA